MATDALASLPSRQRQARPVRVRPIIVLTLVGVILAAGWVVWNAGLNGRFDGRGGLSSSVVISRDLPIGGRYPGDPYIGTKVCAECHPGEYALFTGSGHASTFRTASERMLIDQLAGTSSADPEKPGVRWEYEKKNDQFLIGRREAGKIEKFVVDYALGSGHHATTFVTVMDLAEPRILEHRLTHYRAESDLKITPGQSMGESHEGKN